MLIAGRVVQAIGAALMMPTSLALLLAATPPESRAPTVAMWGGVTALGVAAGPSLGSVLVDAGGWRWAFLVNLPVALVAGVLARRSLTESAVGGPLPDVAGIGLITAAVASMALGITQGSEGGWGWADPRTLAAFAVAVALVPVIIHRSRTQPVPALDLTLFANRTVPLANAAALVFGIAFFGMLLSNVLFLRNVWGYSTLAAGLAITPGPLIVAVLSKYTGRLSQRIGYRTVLLIGAGFFVSGELAFVALVDTTPAYLATWLLPSVLIALGVAFTMPVLSAAAVAGLPQDRFAAGGAVNQTARQIGAVLGVAVLIAIVGDGSTATLGDFRISWLVGAAAVIVSGAISSFLPGRVPASAPSIAPTPPVAAVAVPTSA